MTDIKNFLIAHWGTILSVLAIGTAVTRALDQIAKALPQFPRLTHFAQVVDEIVVDAVDLGTAVGKLIFGSQTAAADIAKTALLILVSLCLLSG